MLILMSYYGVKVALNNLNSYSEGCSTNCIQSCRKVFYYKVYKISIVILCFIYYIITMFSKQ